MLIPFFLALKNADLPVSIKEYLTLIEALDRDVAARTVDDFYFLSRTCLVKDETLFDRFDRVFGDYFNGVENLMDGLFGQVPEEWLRQLAGLNLSEEDRKKIESLGGFEELMETLKRRLAEQQKRHQGGNKWIGTAGTSPFGNSGFNPEGIRIGGSSMNLGYSAPEKESLVQQSGLVSAQLPFSRAPAYQDGIGILRTGC